jgi:hypothetical protein
VDERGGLLSISIHLTDGRVWPRPPKAATPTQCEKGTAVHHSSTKVSGGSKQLFYLTGLHKKKGGEMHGLVF